MGCPKHSLRAEIDEDAWNQLYNTISCPFPNPTLVNHHEGDHGDQVLKVYEVSSATGE